MWGFLELFWLAPSGLLDKNQKPSFIPLIIGIGFVIAVCGRIVFEYCRTPDEPKYSKRITVEAAGEIAGETGRKFGTGYFRGLFNRREK